MKILLEGHECNALLNSGSQASTVTSAFIQEHGLQVMKLEDLTDKPINILGVGHMHTTPVGYTVRRAQVPKISGFDEDHIFLVIPDNSNFASQVPIILGIVVLWGILNVIKESELDNLSVPWVQTRLTVGLGAWELGEWFYLQRPWPPNL